MNKALGHTFEDKITGFTGIAVGYTEYISGCNQILLSPKVDENGKLEIGHWFDEQRMIKNMRIEKIELDNSNTPGFDMEAPIR